MVATAAGEVLGRGLGPACNHHRVGIERNFAINHHPLFNQRQRKGWHRLHVEWNARRNYYFSGRIVRFDYPSFCSHRAAEKEQEKDRKPYLAIQLWIQSEQTKEGVGHDRSLAVAFDIERSVLGLRPFLPILSA